MSDYSDILHMPHPDPDPARHPRMSMLDRAAQFSPFAALTGYDDAIEETARLVDRRIDPDEDERRRMDEALAILKAGIRERPEAEVTYFVPDEKKEGGRYVNYRGRLRRIDETDRILYFADDTRIRLEDVIEISLPEDDGKEESNFEGF